MGIRNAAAALALAIQLPAVIATDPPGAPMVGCSAVGCPTGHGSSTSTNCVVAGRQPSLIGLANFKTPIVGDNLTWTETVGYDNTSSTPQFSFERSFYLGAPQGFNLTANVASKLQLWRLRCILHRYICRSQVPWREHQDFVWHVDHGELCE